MLDVDLGDGVAVDQYDDVGLRLDQDRLQHRRRKYKSRGGDSAAGPQNGSQLKHCSVHDSFNASPASGSLAIYSPPVLPTVWLTPVVPSVRKPNCTMIR